MAPLVLWPLWGGAASAERPDAENMGKLLAYTVNCGCVVGEQDWILGVYRELFADAYGEAYADALQAPLQGALKDGWDRNMSLCKRICDQPVVGELQQSLARADGGAIDSSGIRAELGPAPEVAAAVVPETPPEPAATVEALPASTNETPAAQPERSAQTGDDAESAAAAAPAASLPEPLEPEAIAQETNQDGETAIDDETLARERAGDTSALYETAGTGDNWSSSLCRSSPSRPDCRKFGVD